MEDQMNAVTKLLFGVATVIACSSACNYTVGECYPRGEGGGYGEAAVTAGGGIIIPTGPGGTGGFGNAPPKKPPLQCNSSDADEADEADEVDSADEGDSADDADSQCRTDAGDGKTYVYCGNHCPQSDVQCMAGGVISYFKPSNFKFVTIVADDGTDVGGGWQEAKAPLMFAHNLFEITTCQVRVGMPLRTKLLGKIAESVAASYSANAANIAAGKLWPTDLPPGIFCSNFRDEMKKQLESINGLGATLLAP
jgi:hypothetical protein